MMRGFYASDCVSTNGSEEIFNSNVETCLSESPFLSGYVFEADDKIIGYAMIAKSYSTEFGKNCIWLEDLFVIEEYRNQGVGSTFLAYIDKQYPNHLIRLEAEGTNKKALHVYKKCGFSELAYVEFIKSV